MKMLHELMKMKAKKGKGDMSEHHKSAKMKALQDLHSLASSMMAEPLKGAKEVKVAAPDNEGLKAGLEKAKQMLAHGGEVDPDSEPSDGTAQEMARETLYNHKECEGQELNGEPSQEEQEEEAHEDSEMSADEIDAKIAELKHLKEMKSKK